MKTFFHRGKILIAAGFFIFILLFAERLTAQTIYYVTPGGTGSGTGSWSNAAGSATTLQAIISAAPAGSQVWVAAGTYSPSAYPQGSSGGSTARDFAFALKNGVAVYGGFAGTETALAQRDPAANVTILSGALTNSYHVVLSVNNDNTTILDGCTIQSGNANGSSLIISNAQPILKNIGGGVYSFNSSTIITNCIVTNNKATEGAGIAIAQGSPTVSYTQITQNNATDHGGGMAIGLSTTLLSYCKLENNKASIGGGVYNDGGGGTFFMDTLHGNTATAASGMGGGGVCNDGSSPVFIRCLFNNDVTSNGADGGGIYNNNSNSIDSNCVFVSDIAKLGNGGAIYNNGGSPQNWNNVFSNNSSNLNGGAVYIASGSGQIINSTFSNNGADYNNAGDPAGGTGGGVYIAAGTFSLYNNIIWNNTSGLVVAGGSPIVQYNDIQGGAFTTNGNIGTDPLFIGGAAVGGDGIWGTSDDGLQLTAGPTAAVASPAIDAGTNAAGQSATYDLLYVSRPVGAGVDMGAYEAPLSTTLAVTDLNFTAVASGAGTALVQWHYAEPQTVSAYTLWRSVNGGGYTAIATIKAAEGHADNSYTDRSASGDVISYRLEVTLWGGGQIFSSIAVITSPSSNRMELRPSVARQGTVNVYATVTKGTNARLVVTDATGKIVACKALVLSAGDNNIPIDISGFAAGIYYVCVSGPQMQSKVLPLLRL